jgi:hypothetical protein
MHRNRTQAWIAPSAQPSRQSASQSPGRTSGRTRTVQRGITLVEIAVASAAVGALSLAALPIVSSMDDRALTAKSVTNLKMLAAANATYSSDWEDRQFTAVPDDAGTVGGDGAAYVAQIGCPPPFILGWNEGDMWGFWLKGGKCGDTYPAGSIDNWRVYLPLSFDEDVARRGAYGSFRLPNNKAFHDYVNGRFYDPTFYAPKDELLLAKVEGHFKSPSEYVGGEPVESSYCFSPAALFDPKVFAKAEPGIAPWNERVRQGDAYRAPPIGRCRYPSLKTQMIEHNWLQNRPDLRANPHMGGAPWTFNQATASAPVALFFDGHIEAVACERAMRDDAKAGGLWSRDTPLGDGGYYGAQAFDGLIRTSFHILTTGGIEGRDILGAGETDQVGRQTVAAPGASIRGGASAMKVPGGPAPGSVPIPTPATRPTE